MFFPTRRFLAIASRLSKARLAEIRDWPMPKISWSSATVNSSAKSNRSNRNRVGSEIARSELTTEAIGRMKISQYFNK